MNLNRLNYRWKAYPFFHYAMIPRIELISISNKDNIFRFEEARQWCVQTWGDTPIFDIWTITQQSNLSNQHWSYDVSNRNGNPIMRLYLKGNEELALYQLKWN